MNEERIIPAENFLATIEANLDNHELSDYTFREFVRYNLQFVKYTRPLKSNRAPSQPVEKDNE